jgi:thiol-disulfide isomerase/thioredoxin
VICPNCHQFTPDQGYKCMHCNAILQKSDPYSRPEQAVNQRSEASYFFRPWMLIPLALLAILAYLFLAQKGKSHAINAHNPGAELRIEAFLHKGKTNIIDFYSEYCPPCRKISPLIQKLGRQRPDLAILQVDINRKGIKGIDWGSPLARQYELQSIPYFRIYDAEGRLVKQGQEATVEVVMMLAAAGIRE